MWLVETMETGPKHLCSPGGTSSGYCSSEEILVSAKTSNTFKRKSNVSAQLLTNRPLSMGIDRLQSSQDDASSVAKTNATFDGFADSLWDPLSISAEDDGQCNNTPVPQRHVYHQLIAKQLAPSKKPSAVDDICDSDQRIGQTISVWNRHVASELGNPFAQTVDDCRTTFKGSDMSVDVTLSKKPERSSSKPPTVIIRPVARVRGAAPLVSCSTVLRRSATVPSRMPLVAAQGVVSQCSTSKSDHLYSYQPKVVHAESTPSIHEALRDHMYALKVPPPAPVPIHSSCVDLSKVSRMGKSCSRSDAPASHGSMTILEAFLRSTTPCFDANRGSTAIAAEELQKLNVSGSSLPTSAKVHVKEECGDLTHTESSAPSLLKQLLTVSSNNLDLGQTEYSDGDSHSPGMAVDSLLTDGFGLDADLQLDDPLSNGIGLLKDECTNATGEVDADTSVLVGKLQIVTAILFLNSLNVLFAVCEFVLLMSSFSLKYYPEEYNDIKY